MGTVETAPVRQADEDAMPQPLWRRAAQAALANDQEELAGIIHSPRAVTAAGDMIAKGGQEILLHLVVEKQENHFGDPFTIHHPSSTIPARTLGVAPSSAISLINSPFRRDIP
jgi:hypothetical protein